MIGTSKGDIFGEPLELLLEFLARVVGKALSRTFPLEPLDQWGWTQWLWVLAFITAISLAVWALVRRAKKKSSLGT